jgi:hypothetical protein
MLAHGACSAAGAAPDWKLSGFGTLGLVHSNGREADFVASPLKASGAGHTRAWSADVDTRFGAQLDYAPGARWSAVLQVVSEQRLDNSYRPAVEWANVKYQATPDLALRIGRIALPMFLGADSRKIGYTYPWVRPPVEVYGALPIPSSDGVDLVWRWSAGPLRNATQAVWGNAGVRMWSSARLRANHLAGLSDTLDVGAFSARASVLTSVVTMNAARRLFDRLDAFEPGGDALAERYDTDHKRSTVFSLGMSFDPGQWFVMAEGGRTRSNSFLGKTTMFYTSAGYRWGPLTPYAGLATVRADMPTQEPGLPLMGLSAPDRQAGFALNAGLNALLKTIPVQSTRSAGVRWDLQRNLALKLQYNRVTPKDGSRGTLVNTQPGFVSGRTIQVGSAALDFVY